MGLVRTKILALPRPIEIPLSRIANDLGVSRQYVHQIIKKDRIPHYNSNNYGRLKPFCKGCRVNRVEGHHKKFCRKCIDQNIHNSSKRTGMEFKCCKCNKTMYRRPSYIKRMKSINSKTHCYNCYFYNS